MLTHPTPLPEADRKTVQPLDTVLTCRLILMLICEYGLQCRGKGSKTTVLLKRILFYSLAKICRFDLVLFNTLKHVGPPIAPTMNNKHTAMTSECFEHTLHNPLNGPIQIKAFVPCVIEEFLAALDQAGTAPRLLHDSTIRMNCEACTFCPECV